MQSEQKKTAEWCELWHKKGGILTFLLAIPLFIFFGFLFPPQLLSSANLYAANIVSKIIYQWKFRRGALTESLTT